MEKSAKSKSWFSSRRICYPNWWFLFPIVWLYFFVHLFFFFCPFLPIVIVIISKSETWFLLVNLDTCALNNILLWIKFLWLVILWSSCWIVPWIIFGLFWVDWVHNMNWLCHSPITLKVITLLSILRANAFSVFAHSSLCSIISLLISPS